MQRLASGEANIYHSFARQLFEGVILVNTHGSTVDISLRKVRTGRLRWQGQDTFRAKIFLFSGKHKKEYSTGDKPFAPNPCWLPSCRLAQPFPDCGV